MKRRASSKNGTNGKVNGNGRHGEYPPVTFSAEQVDAEMWPVHPAAWFQREMAPVIPAWSGLGIERRNRAGLFDFAPVTVRPVNCAAEAGQPFEFVKGSGAATVIPASGLAPMGWDARALADSKGKS
jgi:hypothetical protein